MINRFLIIFLALMVASCGGEGEPSITKNQALDGSESQTSTLRGDHVATYFGVEVDDPYRWLEDDLSSDTADWIA